MSQCIYCFRCVHICEELQGQFVWQIWNRGRETRIVPDSGTTLRESSCVSCGACVDTCPTGALEDKSILSLATEGRLKALWSIGYDVAASSFEKDGTFMNAERRIQRVRKAVEPVGESKADWEIICVLARAMDKGEFFDFQSAEDIWNEVRAVWPAGQGITYGWIESGGLQWPCPTETHLGTEVLHGETFPIGKRAALCCVEYRPTAETLSDDFPFLLVTGRNLYQFNAGTMTLRTKNTELSPTDFLDISPSDAQRLRLQNGERVKIRSRYGEAVLPVRISTSVDPGELFATFHTPSVFLNYVTGPYRDGYVDAPEYKVTAVRIEQI